MYQKMKLGTSVDSYQNFKLQIYLFFHHYCNLTYFPAGGSGCKSALDTLTGWPVSLGENTFRKAFKETDRNRETKKLNSFEQARTHPTEPGKVQGHPGALPPGRWCYQIQDERREIKRRWIIHKIIHICPKILRRWVGQLLYSFKCQVRNDRAQCWAREATSYPKS